MTLSTQAPNFGVKSCVLVKLFRVCGADVVIIPSAWGTFAISESETVECVSACVERLADLNSSFPAPSGGKWAIHVPLIHRKLRSSDFLLIVGAGVFNHPMGPQAGAASLIQAWEATTLNQPLDKYAKKKKELRSAMGFFEKPHNKTQIAG
jgi:ribulose-bisphosphate carboxylase large chain